MFDGVVFVIAKALIFVSLVFFTLFMSFVFVFMYRYGLIWCGRMCAVLGSVFRCYVARVPNTVENFSSAADNPLPARYAFHDHISGHNHGNYQNIMWSRIPFLDIIIMVFCTCWESRAAPADKTFFLTNN